VHHEAQGNVSVSQSHFCVQVVPGMVKADIKAAFRRMPIKSEHRWAAAIVFKAEGKVQ